VLEKFAEKRKPTHFDHHQHIIGGPHKALRHLWA
jgi:hypothetical protein